ncbi:predicted protein [Coccidioides posadasii str. Silveira]|uniref:Predicted protein n=1 Tax=Coccidioides posadasii (strain RMSCC 757 / Silveira) TaxID=443226 RepID=E9CR19_COCPS|nr:predicted protein [Coccidioides posadasii str. Silveira]
MDEREKQAQPPLRVIADTTFFGFWKSQRWNFGNSLWLEDPSRVQESMTRGLCNLRALGGDPSNSHPTTETKPKNGKRTTAATGSEPIDQHPRLCDSSYSWEGGWENIS